MLRRAAADLESDRSAASGTWAEPHIVSSAPSAQNRSKRPKKPAGLSTVALETRSRAASSRLIAPPSELPTTWGRSIPHRAKFSARWWQALSMS